MEPILALVRFRLSPSMLKNGMDATRGIIDRRDAMNSLYQKALPLAKQSIYNLIPKGYKAFKLESSFVQNLQYFETKSSYF